MESLKLDSLPSNYVSANNLRVHYVRSGQGPPMVLLHGWPEFWYTWRHCIPTLAKQYSVVAPDLRGFGDTEKSPPGRNAGSPAETLAEDLLGLIDELGFDRIALVSGDVGAYASMAFARKWPERLRGLFFFCCPYPGIGRRYGQPDHLIEVWYQYFNQLPWAAELVGSSRESCRTYFKHFLDHWSGDDPTVFAQDLEIWVDNFMKPGNIQGGFNWYLSSAATRLLSIEEKLPLKPKIEVPSRFLWGKHDPIVKPEWSDRLQEYFASFTIDFVDAGHFVHYQRPDIAVPEILHFFEAHK